MSDSPPSKASDILPPISQRLFANSAAEALSPDVRQKMRERLKQPVAVSDFIDMIDSQIQFNVKIVESIGVAMAGDADEKISRMKNLTADLNSQVVAFSSLLDQLLLSHPESKEG